MDEMQRDNRMSSGGYEPEIPGVDAAPAGGSKLSGFFVWLRASRLYALLTLQDHESSLAFHGVLAAVFVGMLWLGYSLVGVVLISFVVAATGNAVVMAVNKLAGLERPIAPPASLVVDEALVESLGKHVWTEHARPLLQSARETLRLESWERDARVIAAVYVAAGAASLLSAGTMATLWCAATAACMADHRFAAQVLDFATTKVEPAAITGMTAAVEARRSALATVASKVPPIALAGGLIAIASLMLLQGGFLSLLWLVWFVAAAVAADSAFLALASVFAPAHAHAE